MLTGRPAPHRASGRAGRTAPPPRRPAARARARSPRRGRSPSPGRPPSGIVRVSPCRLPAKVIVAPNSPSARAQQSTAPATSAGRISGSVTRRKTVSRPGAERRRRLVVPRSAERRAPSTAITRNGIATNVSASTTAAVVNGSVIAEPGRASWPTIPLRPNTSSSATPPTTGGSTSGSVTSARSSRMPGQRWPAPAPRPAAPRAAGRSRSRAGRRDQREPQRVEHLGVREDADQRAPGRADSSPTSGTTRSSAPEERRDAQRPRRALPACAHQGLSKPASSSTSAPSSESTRSTNSAACFWCFGARSAWRSGSVVEAF